MKRKNPRTLRGWAAKYRRLQVHFTETHNSFEDEVAAYKERLLEAREEIARLKAARHRANAADWAAFDRAVDATTASELALFQASPAYIKYQQEAAAREERRPFTDAERARRMLIAGNWRAP